MEIKAIACTPFKTKINICLSRIIKICLVIYCISLTLFYVSRNRELDFKVNKF